MSRKYKVRYLIQEWNKPVEELTKQVIPGVRSVASDYGYADDVLICSIARDGEGKGKIASVLLVDSVSMCGKPPREILERVREMIDHYLGEHCEK